MGYHIRILAGEVGRGVGSHMYHQELTRRLAARGHHVSVVCFASVPELRDSAEVFEIPPADYTDKRFLWRFAVLFQYRHLSRELMRLNMPPADIVIGGEHLFLRAYRRRFPQTPLIYLPHAPVAAEEIKNYALPPLMGWITSRFYCYLQRWALNSADRTLRFTHVGCEILKRYYGKSIHERFVVNPAGFELPRRHDNKTVAEEIRMLSIGRLVPWKKIDLSLATLAKLRQYRWRFDVVGEGEAREQLEGQVRELGLEDRVRFHGYQTDVGQWYEQADLFLFPSACEGLGFVMLEAMSYGVPCLAIKADLVNFWNANEEVIDHGKSGLLAADEADFVRQLESVLRHPQQLISLREPARQHVAEYYNWDKHLDRYQELFEELLAEGRHERSNGKRLEVISLPRQRTKPMPVLYTHSSSLIGGGNKVLLSLFEGLDRSRFEPISVIPEPGPLEAELRRLEIPSLCVDLRPQQRTNLSLAQAILHLSGQCFKYRIRMLHANDPVSYRYASIASRFCTGTNVCHVHHPGDTREGLAWAFRSPPNLILTPSLFMKREVLACLLNRSQSRVETVWNEVDTDWFAPAVDPIDLRLRLGLDPIGKHICVIAALTPHKGHVHFLQIAKRILSRVSRTTFHIIGSAATGSERHGQFLAELARDMQISERVRFWGFVPDSLARDILCASDLFILPTEEEGFGLSVAEAQSCQVPVLTSSIPPMDEVVDNGRTGYLIDPQDYDKFADQAVRLLECDEVRKEMGIAGRRWVCKHFSHPTHAMRVMSLYEEISSGKMPASKAISQHDS